MKLPKLIESKPRLTTHDIRAVTAEFAHPEDPLAGWHFECAEWQKACAELQQLEHERIVMADAADALEMRQHRYLLFLLLTHGEELALELLKNRDVEKEESDRLVKQVDAFLGTLRDSLSTWHGEVSAAHREALSPFLA